MKYFLVVEREVEEHQRVNEALMVRGTSEKSAS